MWAPAVSFQQRATRNSVPIRSAPLRPWSCSTWETSSSWHAALCMRRPAEPYSEGSCPTLLGARNTLSQTRTPRRPRPWHGREESTRGPNRRTPWPSRPRQALRGRCLARPRAGLLRIVRQGREPAGCQNTPYTTYDLQERDSTHAAQEVAGLERLGELLVWGNRSRFHGGQRTRVLRHQHQGRVGRTRRVPPAG